MTLVLQPRHLAAIRQHGEADYPHESGTFPNSRTMLDESMRNVPDASAVLFLRGGATNRSASLYELDVESGTERLLLSAETLLGGAKETLSVEEKAD